MEEQNDSSVTPGAVALLLLFILLTSGAALLILMRSGASERSAARPEPAPVQSPFPTPEERAARLPDPTAPVAGGAPAVRQLWETPEDLSAATGAHPVASAAATPAPTAARPQPPAAPAPSADADLVKAGLPPDERKAQALAADKGLFVPLFRSLAKHPKLLRALLDNDAVVKGFMSREVVKKNCSSPEAMESYLKSPQVSGRVGYYLGFMQQNPGTASAMAGTKLVTAMMNCPGGKGLMNNPGALSGIVSSNPNYMNMLTNPEIMKSVMASPETAGAFMGLQGGRGGR